MPAPRGPDRTGPLSGSALTRRTSLVLKDGVGFDEWKRIGQHIQVIGDSSMWWLGDWLVYGQRSFPDRYKQAMADTSLGYQTLRNYAWVAGRFAPARRRAGLSFQHHAEVAAMPEDDQDDWLDKAAEQSWSRNRLRAQIRAGRLTEAAPGTVSEVVRVMVNADSQHVERWREAASRADQDLAVWMTGVLNDASAPGD